MATALAGIPLKAAISAQAQRASRPTQTPKEVTRSPRRQSGANALDNYSRATFAAWVGTKFSVKSTSSAVVDIKLVEVSDDCGSSSDASGGECFSLLFVGPAKKTFTQNTYQIEHPALGKFSLFLVRVDRPTSTGQVNYEAVINRRQS